MDFPNNTAERSKDEPSPTPAGVRKLAAIMFTDIKDFSKKMGKNEAATMNLLETHDRLISGVVEKHGGTVVKTIGDAFLVSFESVVNAAKCAIGIQQECFEHNNQVTSENDKIIVRIGIHLGDIVVKGNDVFGDGVNIAARIQPLSDPGGIAISEDAARQLRAHLDLRMIKLGRSELKNISLPVVIYKVVMPWEKFEGSLSPRVRFITKQKRIRKFVTVVLLLIFAGVALVMQTSVFEPSLTAGDRTIAVLSLANAGDADLDYLSDGMSEYISKRLSAREQLLTISWSNSSHFKNSRLPDTAIASNLGVRFLLRGSLRVVGTEVKITTSLFDAKKAKVVWLEMYDTPRAKLFSIGDEISMKMSEFFSLSAAANAVSDLHANSEVLETFYKGLYHAGTNKKDDNALAIEYFFEAVQKDSEFTRGLTDLAEAQIHRYETRWDESPRLLTDAERICQRVLTKDPNNPDALSSIGTIEELRGHQAEAIRLYTKALDKHPNHEGALTRLAIINLLNLGEPARAVMLLKKVQEVQPISAIIRSNLGVGYAQMKNYPQAIQSFRKSIDLDSNDANSWNNLAYVFERLGQSDSAILCYRMAVLKEQSNPLPFQNLVELLVSQNQIVAAESTIRSGLRYFQDRHELLYDLGIVYSLQNRKSEAQSMFSDGLLLLKSKIQRNPSVSQNLIDRGLFHARHGESSEAIASANQAFRIDSLNNEILIKISGLYAVLGMKEKMVEWFKRAHTLNSEYDIPFLTTAIDFSRFKNDPDLQSIARQQ